MNEQTDYGASIQWSIIHWYKELSYYAMKNHGGKLNAY